ncbi:hypothetical protein [Methylobacterium gnaphalii]|nr:hypothetical protein [Methylobacterium gnaphalii]
MKHLRDAEAANVRTIHGLARSTCLVEYLGRKAYQANFDKLQKFF